jgi:hypothetical protein
MELEGRLTGVKGRKVFKSSQSVFAVNVFNKLGETNPGTSVK